MAYASGVRLSSLAGLIGAVLPIRSVGVKADLRAFLAKQYAADDITPQEIETVINRLEAYSDAVLAIVATVLVVPLVQSV